MSTHVPESAVILMHDRWELMVTMLSDSSESERFYAELSRWGMAKNGARRRRDIVAAGGATLTEAVENAVSRAQVRGLIES